jgi:KDO2-lipid IV(A) lauroyltransferase
MIDRFLYTLARMLLLVLGVLPFWMRRSGARLLGRLLYLFDGTHRRIAIKNITLAFGEQKTPSEIEQLARRVFTNLFDILFEVAWSLRLNKNQLSAYFTISGFEHYQRALSGGKGVLLMTAHFGNWEMLSIVVHLTKISAYAVYRPIDLPFLDRLIKEIRTRFGAPTIATRTGAMQKIYRALRNEQTVGLLIDQNEGWRQGVYVDLFGHRACTNPGIAVLSLKTGAPVVPLFLIRCEDGFHAEFGEPVVAIRTGDERKDIEENMQVYNKIIESYVRRHPDQWFWVHNRWKTPSQCPWPDPERRDRWYYWQRKRGRL